MTFFSDLESSQSRVEHNSFEQLTKASQQVKEGKGSESPAWADRQYQPPALSFVLASPSQLLHIHVAGK